MINISVVGANGYTGLYLMNILATHKGVTLKHLISRSNEGVKITDIYPSLFHLKDKCFEELDFSAIAADTDVCFCCLPHGASSEICTELYRRDVKVIDLSADFRYQDLNTYTEWYKVKHASPELNAEAVYGLTEIYRDRIKQASIVGNPGCYTTCSILPLYPLLCEKLISQNGIVIDAKSGTSGAGRKADISQIFSETAENFKAYAVTTHRHTSEIEEQLSIAAKTPVTLNFTPHLLPIKRGILATIYADFIGQDEQQIYDAYKKFYGGSTFVHVLKTLPEIKFVAGSNHCMIGFKADSRTKKLVIVSVIDNLVKGASGQAVQNMNVMFGLPESEGLDNPPCYI